MPFQSALLGFSEGVSALKAAADTGGFTVSGNGVQVLLDAANELYEDLEEMQFKVKFLGEEWPVGATPAAAVYKAHFAGTATDPQQGMVVAIKKMQQDLRSIRESLEKARATYQQTEEAGVQGVKTAGKDLTA